MPHEEQEPVLIDGVESHPAFATVRTSRVTGLHSLFGSEIQHEHVIELTISTATRKRDLNHDSVHSGEEIITVAMSAAQWGEAINSTGNYRGTCATITRRDRRLVPAIPYRPRIRHNVDEVRNSTREALRKIREAAEELSTAIEGKAGIRALREKMSRLIRTVDNAPTNAEFAVTSMQEAMEHIVTAASIEIEARVIAASQQGIVASNPIAAIDAPRQDDEI